MLFKSSKQIPILIRLGIIFIVFGVTFPFYGTPSIYGIARLTFFRLGIIVLLWCIVSQKIKLIPLLRNTPVALFFLLLIFRFASLMISPDFSIGVQQVEWYLEGFISLILLIACARRFPAVSVYIFSRLIVFGTIAACLTALQYWLFTKGTIWALPLEGTSWGRLTGIYAGGFTPVESGFYVERILGPFQDPNMTGTYFVFLVCLLLPSIALTKIRQHWYVFLMLGIIGIAILGSGARQALVAIGIVLIIFYFTSISKTRLLKQISFFGVTIYFIYYLVNYVGNLIRGSLSSLKESDLLSRLGYSIFTEDMSNSRFIYYKKIIDSLDYSMFLFGSGEASSEWGSHNAFLIVLKENGLYALILLILVSLIMFVKAWKKSKEPSNILEIAKMEKASILIVAVWIVVITMNWAQLNQNFSWVFLSLVLINLDNISKKHSIHLNGTK